MKRGQHQSEEAKIKIKLARARQVITSETRKKLSLANKGTKNPFYGKHHTQETIDQIRRNQKDQSGPKCWKWNGGTMHYWNEQAKIRDHYTCRICGLYDPEIVQVDHIKRKSKYPELKFKLDNLQTLCPNCHARKTIQELKTKKHV
jgi:5-methylcytosine-specific restriction endonuclease McrA